MGKVRWGALRVSRSSGNLPTSPEVFQYFNNPAGSSVHQLSLCLTLAPMRKQSLGNSGTPLQLFQISTKEPRGVSTSLCLATRVWGLTSVTQAKKLFLGSHWAPVTLGSKECGTNKVYQPGVSQPELSSGFCQGELENSPRTLPFSGPHVPHLCNEMLGLQISRVAFWLCNCVL